VPVPFEPPIEIPNTLQEAFEIIARGPHRPIAGGTDVMVQISGELGPAPDRMVDLWRLDELRGIRLDGNVLTIGALTTYTEIRRSSVCRERAPALVDAAATIGAAQIQNRGTLGGNIANASPAGDTLPVLLATDASIIVGGKRGERTIPASSFWVAYRRTALDPDELVLGVRIPVVEDRQVRFRKIGTRRAQAISKVVMALSWRSTDGRWSDVRVALGSVADRPIRAPATEAVLDGAMPTAEIAQRAADAVAAEITPIDDVRSTAAYRRAVAGRALQRLIRDAVGA
jgi:CO/xanthine dehydrogenase FAD-binding subunit